jgi:ElaB/YqjD/DUF883 family membrane-anchored ribosome-binding protein
MRKSANGHSRSVARIQNNLDGIQSNLSGVVSGAGAVINDTFHSVVDATKAEGERAVTYARDTVRERPLVSVAAAFGAGAVAAFLMGMRAGSRSRSDTRE